MAFEVRGLEEEIGFAFALAVVATRGSLLFGLVAFLLLSLDDTRLGLLAEEVAFKVSVFGFLVSFATSSASAAISSLSFAAFAWSEARCLATLV